MSWLCLLLAGLLEVVWATALKLSDGFSRLVPSAVMVVAMIASFVLLSRAVRVLPIGTAYTVWTGIGALGALVVGILWFREPATAQRLFFAALLLVGLVGLKAAS